MTNAAVRRRTYAAHAALLLALWTGVARAELAVESIGLTVADIDRSASFFTDVLGFERTGEVEAAGEELERLQGVFPARVRVARLALGDETVELSEYLAPEGRPMPADSRANDRWFQHLAIVVSDLDRAYARLRAHRVRHASPGPQRLPDWNPQAGGIRAFYFRDPDGHFLELIEYPPGKGDPRWQARERLFLGVDHTAVVVTDTDASVAFYRDVLGMTVAGESENWGSEQERLNGVFGARLRITALRAPRGPGVELLEYLAPSDGRPRPAWARASDLVWWQTGVEVEDLVATERALRAAGVRFVSPGRVALSGAALGFREGVVVADPDGHAVRVTSQRAAAVVTTEAMGSARRARRRP